MTYSFWCVSRDDVEWDEEYEKEAKEKVHKNSELLMQSQMSGWYFLRHNGFIYSFICLKHV